MAGIGSFSGNSKLGKYGISNNHAFSWIGTWEITTISGKKVKLIKFRNPWSADYGFAGE